MIRRVEFASFTFEYYEHVPAAKGNFCFHQLANRGCAIAQAEERAFRITCPDEYAHAFAGWMLMRSVMSRFGRVVAVTGAAEMQADKYRDLPTRYKTRKR
jgi:hypothetical protein